MFRRSVILLVFNPEWKVLVVQEGDTLHLPRLPLVDEKEEETIVEFARKFEGIITHRPMWRFSGLFGEGEISNAFEMKWDSFSTAPHLWKEPEELLMVSPIEFYRRLFQMAGLIRRRKRGRPKKWP